MLRVFAQQRRITGLLLAVLAAVYLWRHQRHPLRPTSIVPVTGWWWWTDQSRYLAAARAWASGVLDPAQHWYLPGYPLLAAPFTYLTPTQPFLIPDLFCLLAACWAFASLAARLMPDVPYARVLGAVVFIGAAVLKPWALDAWVIPWSTTPTAWLTFACLAQALRFSEAPSPRPAFWVTLSGASIALFRPTDVVITMLGVSPFMLAALLHRWPGWRGAGRIMCAVLVGAVIPAAILLAAHLAVYGFALGPYLEQSAGVGFEWSLVPLRWVLIVLSPRPLFAEGPGLAAMFPWFLPGFAGMAACLVAGAPSGRGRHLLVIGVTLLHVAFYLAYRDLHPQGLWRYNNYHYFKWVIPVLALYTVLLAIQLLRRNRLHAASAGLVVLALLIPWRAEWEPDPSNRAAFAGPHAITLSQGLSSPWDAVLIAGEGSWEAKYSGNHGLREGGLIGTPNNDLKAFPVPGGLLLEPLRSFPAGEALITLDPAFVLNQAIQPRPGRQRVSFGIPCLLLDRQPSCSPMSVRSATSEAVISPTQNITKHTPASIVEAK